MWGRMSVRAKAVELLLLLLLLMEVNNTTLLAAITPTFSFSSKGF
jgi:hypothetical protein